MEKTIKRRNGPRKPKIWFGSRLRVGKVLAPYNACPKAVPLIKYANKDMVCKMFDYPKNNKIKKQKYFLGFWARQGLTLLLRILSHTEKSGLRSSFRKIDCLKMFLVFEGFVFFVFLYRKRKGF